MKNSILITTLLTPFLAFTSCKKDKDDPAKKELTIAFSGLEDLGDNFAYEATADTAINAGETRATASIEEINFDTYF